MIGQLLDIGQVLDGRYRIIKVLPAGGFGQTYVAEDIKRPGNPQCVVKQLRPHSNNPKTLQIARRLFETEAETLEKLGHHDKIPRLFAYFEDNQDFYLVEEFIPGQPLNEILLGQPLPEEQVLSLLTEVLETLVFVHGQNVIHRDIKPANLMRRHTDGKIVLIDFGAVKEVVNQIVNSQGQVTASVAIGTPGYMPIEQFHGNPQFNSDIYALSIVGIEALTGLPANELSKLRNPSNPNTGQIVWRHRAQVSPELADVLDKMVRFDYNQRYQSATQVLNELANLINKQQRRRHPPRQALWLFLAGAATLIAVGGITFAFYQQTLINKANILYNQAVEKGAEKASRGDYQGSTPRIFKSHSPSLGNKLAQKLLLNGQVVNGTLGRGDAVFPNKSYYKAYVFEGRALQQVTIEMTSKDIDPTLILLNADGSQLARNDDISPSNFNARIVATLPKDGIYVVLANSFEAGQAGAYSIRAKVTGSR